ncbi:MAG: hypothetical protein HHAS10_08400 [Candidatus Altimarinota bacterium]
MSHKKEIVDEVTGLFPVSVKKIFTPESIEDIQKILKEEPGKISIGGGRYSMGGQTAVLGGIQIDMRKMKKILHFDEKKKCITVETGITWRDIQDYIDPYNLSVMTMQTYSNFTVGGSLSVNVHGRYIGYGPLILSVESIKIILADGTIKLASKVENSDIFFAAIGGYGGIGIIIEATLHLKENSMLERKYEDMDLHLYGAWFRDNVRNNRDVIFHNADIYPPHYKKVRATSWEKTKNLATTKDALISRNGSYPIHRIAYFLMTYFRFGRLDFGKWIRESIIDPLVYAHKEVHSRNYEASYDVAELEPKSREKTTYVLEEYFCPVDKINIFVPKMAEIFQRHNANIVNISIRHALPDNGSILAWAKEEVFAFVVYYNQETTLPRKREVAVWTRELIDVVLGVGGRYYLPYQLHGSLSQIKKAYPRFQEYCDIKQKYDPSGKFSNSLLEKYYFETTKNNKILSSRFHTIYHNEEWRDKFFIFLQNIFHVAPTHLFHSHIWDLIEKHKTDKEIYLAIQSTISQIKPLLADIRFGIPSLYKQKNEIVQEVSELIPKKGKFNGYLEVGGAGRYIHPMKKTYRIHGPVYLVSDEPIDYSPVRVLERGKISKYNTKRLTYSSEDLEHIPTNSLDLVSIFIGLHHAPVGLLDSFVSALSSKLRKGGILILRDHNVHDPFISHFVSIAHDIYNAGTGISWDQNESEQRNFRSTQEWKDLLGNHALRFCEKEVLQQHDPTLNTLMCFIKE